MFDMQGMNSVDIAPDTLRQGAGTARLATPLSMRGALAKRAFDIVISLILLVPLGCAAIAILVLNPFLNQGRLLFLQRRMGRDCQGFTAIKFRTMSQGKGAARGAFDALETSRITRLGRFLRKARIDELPQIINVLRGEMSLIGPRPDCFDHATVYLRDVPGYRARHSVLPGISGLAQTEVGYVDGRAALDRKVRADLHYIACASFALDLWIAWRTVLVVVLRKGV